MIDLQGFKQLLAKKGFDEAAINRITEQLVVACPWIAKPSAQVDDLEAEAKFGQLEAFFAKHGLSVHDLFEPKMDEDQWEHVYKGVVKTLQTFGLNNELGEGDFWVIEDFYGTPEILVEVHREKVVSEFMRDELRRFLKENAPTFSVILRKVRSTDTADEVITG